MSDEPKLLPCPFCGGEASAEGYQRWTKPCPDMTWSNGEPVTEAYFCNCPSCGVANTVSDVGHQTRADAIAAWNRRVPAPAVPDDVSEQVARLRKAYALVAEFPESKPDGFMNLLALRNLTPDAAATIEAQAAELARYREALQPFASAWRIAQASGLTSMVQLGSLARDEVFAVAFMKAAALTQPTGDRT